MLHMDQLEHEAYRLAQQWVKEAGEWIRARLRKDLSVHAKKNHQDLVTDIDTWVETYLTDKIQEHYPDHRIIGEENVAKGNESGRYLWIIDPVDGTTNLINRRSDFAISVAFCERDRGIFGIVNAVMNDKCFRCHSGEGAYLNDVRLDRLRASRLENELLAITIPWSDMRTDERLAPYLRLIDKARGIRVFGATTIELCDIAEGKLGAFVQHAVNTWDYAASRVILEELGCKTTDLSGRTIPWTHSGGLIIACPPAHEQIVELLNT